MLHKNSIENELQRRAVDLALRRKAFHKGALKFSLLSILLVGGALDFWMPWSQIGRWLFLVLWVSVIIGLFRRYRWISKNVISAREVARDYERSTQSSDLTLSTSVDPTVIHSAGEDPKRLKMLERLESEANKKLSAISRSQVNRQWDFNWSFWSTAVLVALIALGIKSGWLPYIRLIAPWSPATYTRVLLITDGDLAPIPGEAFRLQGLTRGRFVDVVEIIDKQSKESIAKAKVNSDGSFEVTVPGVQKEQFIAARAGDGQSRWVTVFPFNFESSLDYKIVLTPPNYVQSDPVTLTDPNFKALRGSRMTFGVRLPDNFLEIQWSEVRSLEDESLQGRLFIPFSKSQSGPGRWMSAGTELSQSVAYKLRLSNSSGSDFYNEKPFEIQVLLDSPPFIRLNLVSEEEDLLGESPGMTLKIEAEEDVGLDSLKLIVRKLGQDSVEIPITLPESRPITKFSLNHDIDLTSWNVSSGDVLVAQAKALDNNTLDGPGEGMSEMLFIEIPFPPSDNDGGGGGGGGETVVVNPLENQKRILNDTIALIQGDPVKKLETIALDQGQNLEWSQELTQELESQEGGLPILVQMYRANAAMRRAGEALVGSTLEHALVEEEEALAGLVEALKLMGEQPPGDPPPEASAPGTIISLQRSSSSSKSESDPNAEQNAIEELLSQLREALEAQQGLEDALDEEESSEWDEQESAMAQELEALMNQLSALGLPWAAGQSPGAVSEMRGALSQLGEASAAESSAASAFSQNQMDQASSLAGEGSAAMESALNQLETLLMSDKVTGVESLAAPSQYQRWVNDYLRSVSYEE